MKNSLSTTGQTQTRPVYDNYEIQGCREYYDGAGRYVEPCDDAEAQFWTLYGHINGEGVLAIGDFQSREAAEEVYYRITGQEFGSHDQVEARLRLMHAAPKLQAALWAAMPFVEQWSDWVHACEDYGERSDAIDRQHGQMLEAFAEAIGSSKEAVRVTLGIEQLTQADRFTPDEANPGKVTPVMDSVPDGFAPVIGDAWAGLTAAHQEFVLRHHVNWSGFGRQQVDQVIRNVIGGEPKEQWFAGVGKIASGDIPASGAGLPADQSPPAAGQRQPWPSEIARANRQKRQDGQEQDKSNANGKANGQDGGNSL
jgi:hypothetical protein